MANFLDMLAVVKKLAELRGSCRHARQAQNADEDWDTLDQNGDTGDEGASEAR